MLHAGTVPARAKSIDKNGLSDVHDIHAQVEQQTKQREEAEAKLVKEKQEAEEKIAAAEAAAEERLQQITDESARGAHKR